MIKLFLAALAAVSITAPIGRSESNINVSWWFRVDMASFISYDTRVTLETMSNALYDDAGAFVSPVQNWLDCRDFPSNTFDEIENTVEPYSFTEEQLKPLADTLFIDYLYAQALANYIDKDSPLEITRGILDHLTTLSNDCESAVYYYALERENGSVTDQDNVVSFFTYIKNVYLGIKEIVTEFITEDKTENIFEEIRRNYHHIASYNAENGILYGNYAAQFKSITDFCISLESIEDEEKCKENKEAVEACFDSYLSSDFSKKTAKELLGVSREEIEGY